MVRTVHSATRTWCCVRGWGRGVDPVTVVVAALVAGASAGISGAVSTAVGDAYAGLRRVLGRRLRARGADPAVLDARGADPAVLDAGEAGPAAWQARLARELTASDVDAEVAEAAQRVLAVADPEGSRAGRYTVDLRGARGVQVGDGNTQHNTFG